MMNMASAAARYSPTASAAITANRQIRRNVAFQQRRDRVAENPVAAKDRKNRGRIDPEDRRKHAEQIQQQQDADRGGETEIPDALAAFLVHLY
jgi:hypothetical protein